ncbi:GNAT family protein [Paludicola sp. MB14-C6]|uniref:GNAT family N-acetyltransferase n=1 Tax=Paludihabitans sp. MB14-C6 TaxID=3070656 RepID=UPI0027DC1098|nr:GNAT family protein [Paludicola sp. MB14-C6]WMJ24383.1 GNAT family protein [Paludicola sp. MB14-C6]
MLQTTYETNRLLLMQSNPRLKKQVLAYYKENDPFLQVTEPKHPNDFVTLATQKVILKQDWIQFQYQTGVRYWIFQKENPERIIGLVGINNIIMGPFQSGYVAYKCHKNELNKGYITEALEKLIFIAFHDLGLHRLEANIMPRNVQSLRVVEKLHFEKEGLAKSYLKINGKWEDHIHFVLLNKKKE